MYSNLSLDGCFLSERAYASINGAIYFLSTHMGVSAMWSGNVTAIAMAHTFFFSDREMGHASARDVLPPNDLVTGQRTDNASCRV